MAQEFGILAADVDNMTKREISEYLDALIDLRQRQQEADRGAGR